MTAPDLMRAAVTCDYASECMEFLRSRFDISDPDPAVTAQEVAEFDSRMRKLFIDGYILAKPLQDVDAPKTACRMVFDEIEDSEPRLGCSPHLAGLFDSGSTMVIASTISPPRQPLGK